MAGVSQESGVLGTVCHQAPVTPVASDLMSSPLRKRIRSPDLREALSAGLPGSKERGCGQLSSDPLGVPVSSSCFTGEKWDAWQRRAKFRPAAPHYSRRPSAPSCLKQGAIAWRGCECSGPGVDHWSALSWGRRAEKEGVHTRRGRYTLYSILDPSYKGPHHKFLCAFVTRRRCV